MIHYDDIKTARKVLRNLQKMYRSHQVMQEILREYLKNGGKVEFDIVKELTSNRLLLNELQTRIRSIRKNVRELDMESTNKDIARRIKESLERYLKK